MAIDTYSPANAGNLGLGQAGSIFIDDATDHNNVNVVAVQFVTDCTFTKLEPKDVEFMGTSTGSVTPNGNAIDTSNTFPTGQVIFGAWGRVKMATGTAICYLAGYNR